jgi:hypothetical protein
VTQLYPKFELVLGVADSRDPALTIVARLRRAYPQAELRVVIHGEEDPLANPKVISLSHMARAAKYEHLLARVASDGLLCRRATGSWPSLTALVMLPVKDTLLLGVWLIALMRKSVTWRGHQLRITKGSRLVVPIASLETFPRLYGRANS